MQEINVIGLDLAKNIFHVYGVNRQGQPVVSRKLRRNQMHSYFRQLPATAGVPDRHGVVRKESLLGA